MRMPLDVIPVWATSAGAPDTYRVEAQRTPGDLLAAAYALVLYDGIDTPAALTLGRPTLVHLLDCIHAAVAPAAPARGTYAGALSFVNADDADDEDEYGALEVRRVPDLERPDGRTYELTPWPAGDEMPGAPATVRATWPELAAAVGVLLDAAMRGVDGDD